MVLLAIVAIFTMFEIFGRGNKRFNVDKLKRIHKINGIIYFLIFGFITYFCLNFIVLSQSELSARGTFHGIFALAILVLFGIKISILRFYRQFYEQVKIFGLLIALITFGMVGVSGGYYLLITKFGTDMTFDKIMQYKKGGIQKESGKEVKALKIIVKTDPESIGRGKNLFDNKCIFCHDANSTETIVGPGLKGVLKNPVLPVSKKPATPENIADQLKNPFQDMPSFSYLSDEDVLDIIAFLNTL